MNKYNDSKYNSNPLKFNRKVYKLINEGHSIIEISGIMNISYDIIVRRMKTKRYNAQCRCLDLYNQGNDITYIHSITGLAYNIIDSYLGIK